MDRLYPTIYPERGKSFSSLMIIFAFILGLCVGQFWQLTSVHGLKATSNQGVYGRYGRIAQHH